MSLSCTFLFSALINYHAIEIARAINIFVKYITEYSSDRLKAKVFLLLVSFLISGNSCDMALSAGRPKKHPDSFSKKVLLLKNDDFERIGDQIKMPNYSEMSDIRTKEGQYKKNVEFHASMSEGMVKKNLEETFPYLKDKR